MIVDKHAGPSALDRLKQFLKYRILHVDDSPHRIALGVGLGLFIAWTPFIGFHMLMVLGLAIVLRANKLVALAWVWVCNPLTYFPVFYPSYLLGRALLKLFRPGTELSSAQVEEMFGRFGSSPFFTNFFRAEFRHDLVNLLWQIGYELCVGSAIIGLSIAVSAYFGTYSLIVWYRRSRPEL